MKEEVVQKSPCCGNKIVPVFDVEATKKLMNPKYLQEPIPATCKFCGTPMTVLAQELARTDEKVQMRLKFTYHLNGGGRTVVVENYDLEAITETKQGSSEDYESSNN